MCVNKSLIVVRMIGGDFIVTMNVIDECVVLAAVMYITKHKDRAG